MYFELAYNYGNEKAGVPIIDRSKEPDPNPIPRAANVMENYNYIVERPEKSSRIIAKPGRASCKDYGRPHKAAAWALWQKYICL
jgi:hypothetical protein